MIFKNADIANIDKSTIDKINQSNGVIHSYFFYMFTNKRMNDMANFIFLKSCFYGIINHFPFQN